MMKAKGFDTTQLPAPPSELALPDMNLNVERDVELQLVEPLLRRLGFSDSDWRYQMRGRMGRGERNVPDYVLGPDDRPGEELGVALIECKLDIAGGKDRNELVTRQTCIVIREGISQHQTIPNMAKGAK